MGLARAQRDAGLDVQIVSTFRPGADNSSVQQLRQGGIGVDLIGPCPGRLARHREIRPTLRRAMGGTDIVHIHALWEEVQHQAACLARQLGVPYLIRTCGMLDPWSLKQSAWQKRLYLAFRLRKDLNAAASLHFTTDAERSLTMPLRLRPPSIIEPNGIELSEFAQLPPPGRFRARWPSLSGCPIVLFMSRVHPKKGLDLLIPAFGRMCAAQARGETANRGTMLVIAGPDAQGHQANLERLVVELRLQERVVFTGMLNGAERIEALVDADLFVLSSYQENFGNVVIEAAAAGRPVVVSDQVNLCDEVLAAGIGGVVPASVEPLAAELARWMNDAPLRAAAGTRGREYALSRFDWSAIARRWCEHYLRLRSPSDRVATA